MACRGYQSLMAALECVKIALEVVTASASDPIATSHR